MISGTPFSGQQPELCGYWTEHGVGEESGGDGAVGQTLIQAERRKGKRGLQRWRANLGSNPEIRVERRSLRRGRGGGTAAVEREVWGSKLEIQGKRRRGEGGTGAVER